MLQFLLAISDQSDHEKVEYIYHKYRHDMLRLCKFFSNCKKKTNGTVQKPARLWAGSFFCLPYKKKHARGLNELAKPAKRTSQAIFGDTKERTVAKRNRSQ